MSDKFIWYLKVCFTEKAKLQGQKVEQLLPMGWDWNKDSHKWTQETFWGDGMFLELDGGDHCINMQMY